MLRMQCAARGLVAGRPFELAQEIANRQPSCSSDWLTVSLRGQTVQVVLRLRCAMARVFRWLGGARTGSVVCRGMAGLLMMVMDARMF